MITYRPAERNKVCVQPFLNFRNSQLGLGQQTTFIFLFNSSYLFYYKPKHLPPPFIILAELTVFRSNMQYSIAPVSKNVYTLPYPAHTSVNTQRAITLPWNLNPYTAIKVTHALTLTLMMQLINTQRNGKIR